MLDSSCNKNNKLLNSNNEIVSIISIISLDLIYVSLTY